MKRTLSLLCLVLLLLLSGCAGTKKSGGDLPQFHTTDLKGNPVTNAIFAQKELTVLNVWGTFCGPCIGEMPELGSWARELPENVQIIGLLCDVSARSSREGLLAMEILDKAGADFPNLLCNDELAPFLSTVVGVPTTFYVDSKGELVGEPILGANVAGYKRVVEDYFHDK